MSLPGYNRPLWCASRRCTSPRCAGLACFPWAPHGCTRLVRLLARPEPFKYIHFPTRDAVGLQIDVSSGGERITLSAQKPIKGLILDVEGAADATWSDQAIDLVPGDAQAVAVKGLAGRKVLARYLGDGSA